MFLPAFAKTPIFEGTLDYGHHSRLEAQNDRYGPMKLPQEFHAAGARLIEAEVLAETKEVVKQVWRAALDARRDIVIVMLPNGRVKTVWVNLRSDKHRSLDHSRYLNGGQWLKLLALLK